MRVAKTLLCAIVIHMTGIHARSHTTNDISRINDKDDDVNA